MAQSLADKIISEMDYKQWSTDKDYLRRQILKTQRSLQTNRLNTLKLEEKGFKVEKASIKRTEEYFDKYRGQNMTKMSYEELRKRWYDVIMIAEMKSSTYQGQLEVSEQRQNFFNNYYQAVFGGDNQYMKDFYSIWRMFNEYEHIFTNNTEYKYNVAEIIKSKDNRGNNKDTALQMISLFNELKSKGYKNEELFEEFLHTLKNTEF